MIGSLHKRRKERANERVCGRYGFSYIGRMNCIGRIIMEGCGIFKRCDVCYVLCVVCCMLCIVYCVLCVVCCNGRVHVY